MWQRQRASSDRELGLNLKVQTRRERDYFNCYKHLLFNETERPCPNTSKVPSWWEDPPQAEEGKKRLLNWGPRWENGQTTSLSWEGSHGPKAPGWTWLWATQRSPHLRKVEAIPHTPHSPPTPPTTTQASRPKSQGNPVEKGFPPHTCGPGQGWDSPPRPGRGQRCSRNRVCPESAAPSARCGCFLAPRSGGEDTPDSAWPQLKCLLSLLLVGMIMFTVKGWAQHSRNQLLCYLMRPAQATLLNAIYPQKFPLQKKLVHTWPLVTSTISHLCSL